MVRTATAGAQVRSLVGEVRSHIPSSPAKKKKKKIKQRVLEAGVSYLLPNLTPQPAYTPFISDHPVSSRKLSKERSMLS